MPPNGPSKCRHYIQVFRGSKPKHFIHINVVLRSFKIAEGGIWTRPLREKIWYYNRPVILKITLVLLMVVDFKSMIDQITWMYEFTWRMTRGNLTDVCMLHHGHASLQHFRVSFIIENIGKYSYSMALTSSKREINVRTNVTNLQCCTPDSSLTIIATSRPGNVVLLKQLLNILFLNLSYVKYINKWLQKAIKERVS